MSAAKLVLMDLQSIVFSQFVNFLDLVAFRLQRAGFAVCRLEGTMSPQARDATIKHFSMFGSCPRPGFSLTII